MAELPPQQRQGGNFGRNINHNPDATWDSTQQYIWDQAMGPLGMMFSNIGWEDLEGEKSMHMLTVFSQRVKARPPMYRNNSQPYSSGTVADTLGAVVKKLTSKFRDRIGDNVNAFFPDDEVKKLKNSIRNNTKRNLMEDDETDLFKGTFPIPRESSDRNRIFEPQNIPIQERRAAQVTVDLKHIADYHFRTGQFTKLLKLLLTHNGIGRGGEVKFLNYNTMFFDMFFNMLFLQWFQRKTLKTNPSGFVPDFEHSVLCVFLAFGCFWACDHGLYRAQGMGEPNSPHWRKMHYVFPDLHEIRDDGVADQITRIIRQYIPAILTAYYTAKSLRIGAMSLLTWEPAVSYDEAVALGGWTTNSNRDWYVWQYLIAIIPAVLCLAGYPDVRVIPSLPTLRVLEDSVDLSIEDRMSSAMADELMTNLFRLRLGNILPSFKKDPTTGAEGKHRAFLKCVTAVMIMHFEEHYEIHQSTHKFTKAMVQAVTRSEFERGRHWSDAISLLQKWGVVIKKKFRNESSVGVGDPNLLRRLSTPDQLNKMNASISRLITNRNEHMEQINRMSIQLNKQREHISTLSTQIASLQEVLKVVVHQNRSVQFRLHEFMTAMKVNPSVMPDLPPGNPTTQAACDEVMRVPVINRDLPTPEVPTVAALPATGVAGDITLPVPSPTQAPRGNPAPRQNLNTALMRPRGRATSGRKGTQDVNESLESVLSWLYEHKNGTTMRNLGRGDNRRLDELQSEILHGLFNGDHKSQTRVVKVLQLVDAIWTSRERELVIQNKVEDPFRFFADIAERCRQSAWIIKVHEDKRRYVEAMQRGKPPKDPFEWPKNAGPGKACKTQLKGLANMLGKFSLSPYIPKWGPESRRSGIVSPVSLDQWVESKFTELKQRIRAQEVNPYNKRQRRR